jgi:hypothetical protein
MTTLPPPRYVPVLKVKPGEKDALQMLDAATVTEVWPLFEIVEMKKDEPPDLAHHLRKAFRGLRRAILRSPVYFLDTHEIAPAGRDGAREAFLAAANLGMPFIPVTGISRTTDVDEAFAAVRSDGVAIRLTRAEFERGIVPARLVDFVEAHNIARSNVHLIVDLGPVHDVLPEGVDQMIRQFLPLIPHVSEWRSLIVSSCAFPKSMKVAQTKSTKLVERADWKGWLSGCYEHRTELPRLPTFSDGGIQHPSGVEGYDPKTMPWAAAIRYTVADEWLIVKGESTDVTAGADQFPELARTLVRGSHFVGPDHCLACAAMARATRGRAKGHSRAEDWRRLGTAHHITTTVRQLRALAFEP